MRLFIGDRAWQRRLLLATVLVAAGAPAYGQSPSAIYVMNVDGSDARKVSHSDGRWLGSPSWSHDGKRMAYDSAPATRDYNECRICVEMLNPGEEKNAKVDDLGYGCAPCWSPDDKQLTFHVRPGNSNGETPGVYIMNADGAGRERICDGLRPRWSPDGEKIVVVSRHEGFESLYLYDIFEQELTRVLERGYDQLTGACWSPDGKRLALIGYKGGGAFNGGRGELAIVDAAANQTPKVIKQDRVGWHPDWSPDGKHLLGWISTGGQTHLHLFDVEGNKAPMPLGGPAGSHNSDAVFSPDGKQIALGSDR